MAIRKDIDTDYNVQAGFWKVVSNNYCGNGRYEIIVNGWRNKASYLGRYLPMKRFIFFSDTELVTKNSIESFVMGQPEFSSSTTDTEV